MLKLISAMLVCVLSVQDLSFAYPEKKSAPAPEIYLIEDAHLNISAQLDIAQKIETLIDQKNINLVFLEGGSGDDSLSSLRNLSTLAKRRRVGKSYLNKGYIQGPDYLDLTSDKNFSLWGVEEDRLYWKSVELYRAIKKTRPAMERYLDTLDRAAEGLRRKIYSPALLEFDNRRRAYDQGEAKASEYFEFLWSEAARLGVADIGFKTFHRLAKIRQVRYGHYEKAARALNPEKLLSEKEELEALCVAALAKQPEERQLFETVRLLGIYRNLFELKLDPQDYARLRHSKEKFAIVDMAGFLNRLMMETESHYENAVFLNPEFRSEFKKAQNFYALALSRDRHFLKNAFSKMRAQKQTKAILVAGGFHTRHLKQLAAARGLKLNVIRPKITAESDAEKYEQILLNQVPVSAATFSRTPRLLAVRPAAQMGARLSDGTVRPVVTLLHDDLAKGDGEEAEPIPLYEYPGVKAFVADLNLPRHARVLSVGVGTYNMPELALATQGHRVKVIDPYADRGHKLPYLNDPLQPQFKTLPIPKAIRKAKGDYEVSRLPVTPDLLGTLRPEFDLIILASVPAIFEDDVLFQGLLGKVVPGGQFVVVTDSIFDQTTVERRIHSLAGKNKFKPFKKAQPYIDAEVARRLIGALSAVSRHADWWTETTVTYRFKAEPTGARLSWAKWLVFSMLPFAAACNFSRPKTIFEALYDELTTKKQRSQLTYDAGSLDEKISWNLEDLENARKKEGKDAFGIRSMAFDRLLPLYAIAPERRREIRLELGNNWRYATDKEITDRMVKLVSVVAGQIVTGTAARIEIEELIGPVLSAAAEPNSASAAEQALDVIWTDAFFEKPWRKEDVNYFFVHFLRLDQRLDTNGMLHQRLGANLLHALTRLVAKDLESADQELVNKLLERLVYRFETTIYPSETDAKARYRLAQDIGTLSKFLAVQQVQKLRRLAEQRKGKVDIFSPAFTLIENIVSGARLIQAGEAPEIVARLSADIEQLPFAAQRAGNFPLKEILMSVIESAATEVIRNSFRSGLNYDGHDPIRVSCEKTEKGLTILIREIFGSQNLELSESERVARENLKKIGGTLEKLGSPDSPMGSGLIRRAESARRTDILITLPIDLKEWSPDYQKWNELHWIGPRRREEMNRLRQMIDAEKPIGKIARESKAHTTPLNWEDAKNEMLLLTYVKNDGVVFRAAAELGINKKTVYNQLKKAGVSSGESSVQTAFKILSDKFGLDRAAIDRRAVIDLSQLKSHYRRMALSFTDGNVSRAARILHVNRKTLQKDAVKISQEVFRAPEESLSLEEAAIAKYRQCITHVLTWDDESLMQRAVMLKNQKFIEGEKGSADNLGWALAIFSVATRRAAVDPSISHRYVRSFIGEPPAEGDAWSLPNEKQLTAALLLSRNRQIVGMYPSEGKTLAVVLGAYLKILQGHQVEVHDWNTDLAFRDAQVAGAILQRLGIKVAAAKDQKIYRYTTDPSGGSGFWHPHLVSTVDPKALREADLIYGNYDDLIFLRTHGWFEIQDFDPSTVDRKRWVIVEEADTPLIDEISEPRVIGVRPRPMPKEKLDAFKIINIEAKKLISDKRYVRRGRQNAQLLLGDKKESENYARTVMARIASESGLSDSELMEDPQLVLFLLKAAVEAKLYFQEGRDYLVTTLRGKKCVVLRNENTGETSLSKRLRFYHIFFQINENVRDIEDESVSHRAMTTHYFYNRIAKETGFSAVIGVLNEDGADLLKEMYNATVTMLEPLYPDRKVKIPSKHFLTRQKMLEHTVRLAGEIHTLGKPILINASSPKEADELCDMFRKSGLLKSPSALKKITGRDPHEEINLWRSIGDAGSITIAAQTLGRGYEIKLEKGLYEPVALAMGNQTYEIGGLTVINTHYGRSVIEGEQSKTRAGRRGRLGDYHVTAYIENNPFLVDYVEEELGRYLELALAEGFDTDDEIIPLLFELARKRRLREMVSSLKSAEEKYRVLIDRQFRFAEAARRAAQNDLDRLDGLDALCGSLVESSCKAIDRKDEFLFEVTQNEFEAEIRLLENEIKSKQTISEMGIAPPAEAGARLATPSLTPLLRFQPVHLHWFSGGFLSQHWFEKGYDLKASGDQVYDLLLLAGVQAKMQVVRPDLEFEGVYFSLINHPSSHADSPVQYGDVIQLGDFIWDEFHGHPGRYLLSVSLKNWKEKTTNQNDPEGRIVFIVRRREKPLQINVARLPRRKWLQNGNISHQRGGLAPTRRVAPKNISTSFDLKVSRAHLAAARWLSGVKDKDLTDHTAKLILLSQVSQRVAPDLQLIAINELTYGEVLKSNEKLRVVATASPERIYKDKRSGKFMVPIDIEISRPLDLQAMMDQAAKEEAWRRDRADEKAYGHTTKTSDDQYFSARRDIEAEYTLLGTVAGKPTKVMVLKARLLEKHNGFTEEDEEEEVRAQAARLAWWGNGHETDGWDVEPLMKNPSPERTRHYRDLGEDPARKTDLFDLLEARLDRWDRILAVDQKNGNPQPDGLEMDDLIGYVYQPLVQLYLEHPFDIDRFHEHHYDLGTVKKMIRLSKRTLNRLRQEHANALAGKNEERRERLEECISDVFKILHYYVIYESIIHQLSQARNFVASQIQKHAGKAFGYNKMYRDSRGALLKLIYEIHICGKGLFSRSYASVGGENEEAIRRSVEIRIDGLKDEKGKQIKEGYFDYLIRMRPQVIKKTPNPELRGITRRRLGHYAALGLAASTTSGLLWGLWKSHIPITLGSVFLAFLGILTTIALYFWVADSGHAMQNQYDKRMEELKQFKSKLSAEAQIPDIESTDFNVRVFDRQIAHMGRVEQKALKKRPTDFLFVLSPSESDQDSHAKDLRAAMAAQRSLQGNGLKPIYIPHDDNEGSDAAHRNAYKWIDYSDSFAQVMLKFIKDPEILKENPFLIELIQAKKRSKPVEQLSLQDINRGHAFFHGKSRQKFRDLRGGMVFAGGKADQRARMLKREAALGDRSYLDLAVNEVMEMNLLAQKKNWGGVVHANANKARIGYLTLTGADMEFQAVRASSRAVINQRYTSLILDENSVVKGMNEKGTNALELYNDHRFNISGELNGGFHTIEKNNENVRQIFVMPGLYWRRISRPMLQALANIQSVMDSPAFYDFKGEIAATSSQIQDMARERRVKTTTRINVQPHVEWSAQGEIAAEDYLSRTGMQIGQIADNFDHLPDDERFALKSGVDAFTGALKDAWRRAYKGYDPPPVLGHAGTSFDIYAKAGLIELLKERGVLQERALAVAAARLAEENKWRRVLKRNTDGNAMTVEYKNEGEKHHLLFYVDAPLVANPTDTPILSRQAYTLNVPEMSESIFEAVCQAVASVPIVIQIKKKKGKSHREAFFTPTHVKTLATIAIGNARRSQPATEEWKNPNSKKIAVIGAGGFVGTIKSTVSLCVDHGHDVMIFDVFFDKIRQLLRGESPIYSEGLPEVLREAKDSGRFHGPSVRTYPDNLTKPENQKDYYDALKESIEGRDYIFLCLPTPQSENGEADRSFLVKAVKDIAGLMEPGQRKVLIGKSTAPPDTIDLLKKAAADILKDKPGAVIDFAWEPEFLREGKELEDERGGAGRLVIGADRPEVADEVAALYEHPNPNVKRTKVPLIKTDIKTAMLIKYAGNAFRSLKISYINYISWFAERFGMDIRTLAKKIGLDDRIINQFLQAGSGFGGSCFPKDIAAFAKMLMVNMLSSDIMLDILAVNHYQVMHFVDKIEQELGGVRGKTILVLGGAFKPGTNDTRESRALLIARELSERGALIRIIDPEASYNFKEAPYLEGFDLPDFDVEDGKLTDENYYRHFEKAHAVVLATEWPIFSSTSWRRVKNLYDIWQSDQGRQALNLVSELENVMTDLRGKKPADALDRLRKMVDDFGELSSAHRQIEKIGQLRDRLQERKGEISQHEEDSLVSKIRDVQKELGGTNDRPFYLFDSRNQFAEQKQTLVGLGFKYVPIGIGENNDMASLAMTEQVFVEICQEFFLALKLNFINTMAELAEVMGADILKIQKAQGLDPVNGELYSVSGAGYSGSFALENSVRWFAARSRDFLWPALEAFTAYRNKVFANRFGMALPEKAEIRVPFADTAPVQNEHWIDLQLQKIKKAAGGDLKGKEVAVLGLAFKPDTHAIKDSASIKLTKLLLKEGAKVRATDADPQARRLAQGDDFKKQLTQELPPDSIEEAKKRFSLKEDAKSAVAGTDVQVLMTASPEFADWRDILFEEGKSRAKKAVVVDARHYWVNISPGESEYIHKLKELQDAGVEYHSVGLNVKGVLAAARLSVPARLDRLRSLRETVSKDPGSTAAFEEAVGVMRSLRGETVKDSILFKDLRKELTLWKRYVRSEAASTEAGTTREILRADLLKWLGREALIEPRFRKDGALGRIAGDPEFKPYWDLVGKAFSESGLVREALFMLHHKTITANDIDSAKGIVLELISASSHKFLFKVSVHTVRYGEMKFALNVLRDALRTPYSTGEESVAHLAPLETELENLQEGWISESSKVVEDFAGFWPEYGFFAEEFITGTSPEKLLGQANLKPKLARRVMGECFKLWREMGRRWFVWDPSWDDFLIPETDFMREARLVDMGSTISQPNAFEVLLILKKSFVDSSPETNDNTLVLMSLLDAFGIEQGKRILIEALAAAAQPPSRVERLIYENPAEEARKRAEFIETIRSFLIDGFSTYRTRTVVFAEQAYEEWLQKFSEADEDSRYAMAIYFYQVYNLAKFSRSAPWWKTVYFQRTAFRNRGAAFQRALDDLIERQKLVDWALLNKDEQLQNLCREHDIPSESEESFYLRHLVKSELVEEAPNVAVQSKQRRMQAPAPAESTSVAVVNDPFVGLQMLNGLVLRGEGTGKLYRVRTSVSRFGFVWQIGLIDMDSKEEVANVEGVLNHYLKTVFINYADFTRTEGEGLYRQIYLRFGRIFPRGWSVQTILHTQNPIIEKYIRFIREEAGFKDHRVVGGSLISTKPQPEVKAVGEWSSTPRRWIHGLLTSTVPVWSFADMDVTNRSDATAIEDPDRLGAIQFRRSADRNDWVKWAEIVLLNKRFLYQSLVTIYGDPRLPSYDSPMRIHLGHIVTYSGNHRVFVQIVVCLGDACYRLGVKVGLFFQDQLNHEKYLAEKGLGPTLGHYFQYDELVADRGLLTLEPIQGKTFAQYLKEHPEQWPMLFEKYMALLFDLRDKADFVPDDLYLENIVLQDGTEKAVVVDSDPQKPKDAFIALAVYTFIIYGVPPSSENLKKMFDIYLAEVLKHYPKNEEAVSFLSGEAAIFWPRFFNFYCEEQGVWWFSFNRGGYDVSLETLYEPTRFLQTALEEAVRRLKESGAPTGTGARLPLNKARQAFLESVNALGRIRKGNHDPVARSTMIHTALRARNESRSAFIAELIKDALANGLGLTVDGIVLQVVAANNDTSYPDMKIQGTKNSHMEKSIRKDVEAQIPFETATLPYFAPINRLRGLHGESAADTESNTTSSDDGARLTDFAKDIKILSAVSLRSVMAEVMDYDPSPENLLSDRAENLGEALRAVRTDGDRRQLLLYAARAAIRMYTVVYPDEKTGQEFYAIREEGAHKKLSLNIQDYPVLLADVQALAAARLADSNSLEQYQKMRGLILGEMLKESRQKIELQTKTRGVKEVPADKKKQINDLNARITARARVLELLTENFIKDQMESVRKDALGQGQTTLSQAPPTWINDGILLELWQALREQKNNIAQMQSLPDPGNTLSVSAQRIAGLMTKYERAFSKADESDVMNVRLGAEPGEQFVYHQTPIGAVWKMVYISAGEMSSGSFFAQARGNAVAVAGRFKDDQTVSKSEKITLVFDRERLAKTSAGFEAHAGQTGFHLLSSTPVPLSALTDDSKKEVLEALRRYNAANPDFDFSESFVRTVLDLSGARMAKVSTSAYTFALIWGDAEATRKKNLNGVVDELLFKTVDSRENFEPMALKKQLLDEIIGGVNEDLNVIPSAKGWVLDEGHKAEIEAAVSSAVNQEYASSPHAALILRRNPKGHYAFEDKPVIVIAEDSATTLRSFRTALQHPVSGMDYSGIQVIFVQTLNEGYEAVSQAYAFAESKKPVRVPIVLVADGTFRVGQERVDLKPADIPMDAFDTAAVLSCGGFDNASGPRLIRYAMVKGIPVIDHASSRTMEFLMRLFPLEIRSGSKIKVMTKSGFNEASVIEEVFAQLSSGARLTEDSAKLYKFFKEVGHSGAVPDGARLILPMTLTDERATLFTVIMRGRQFSVIRRHQNKFIFQDVKAPGVSEESFEKNNEFLTTAVEKRLKPIHNQIPQAAVVRFDVDYLAAYSDEAFDLAWQRFLENFKKRFSEGTVFHIVSPSGNRDRVQRALSNPTISELGFRPGVFVSELRAQEQADIDRHAKRLVHLVSLHEGVEAHTTGLLLPVQALSKDDIPAIEALVAVLEAMTRVDLDSPEDMTAMLSAWVLLAGARLSPALLRRVMLGLVSGALLFRCAYAPLAKAPEGMVKAYFLNRQVQIAA